MIELEVVLYARLDGPERLWWADCYTVVNGERSWVNSTSTQTSPVDALRQAELMLRPRLWVALTHPE